MWKKSIAIPAVTVTNPTMIQGSISKGGQITINDCSFDCTQIGSRYIDFFDGFTRSDGFYAFNKKNGNLYYGDYYKVTSIQVTSNTSCYIFIDSWDDNDYEDYTYTFHGTKDLVPAKASTSLGYVVDNDSNAYPNGAVHTDGYYYELLASVPSTNAMSLSDNALAAVQQDYRNQIITEVNT